VVTRALVKSLGSTSDFGFDSPWERNIVGFNSVVLSVVGGVPVDSKAPVMTSSTRGFACSAFKILIGVGFAYVCSYRCLSCKKIGLLYASIFFQ